MNKLLHPRYLGFLLIFLFASQSNYAQTEVIHCWDFNGTTPFTSPLNTDNRVAGDGTITYNFDISNVDNFTGSSTNACNGSDAGRALAVESNTENGSQVFFNFSSVGYQDLTFSFWTQGTSTGFNNNTIEYSTDGTTFTAFPLGPTYIPAISGDLQTFDLSSITGINNQSNLIIRITFDDATGGNGNNRIDNVKLEGTFINDSNSEVAASTSQVGQTTIVAADVTTPGQSEPVLNFVIEDVGGDGLSTFVNQMRFVPGTGNTANWSTTLQDVIIRDGSGVITGTSVITDTEVVFTPDAPVEIPNNGTSSFTAEIVLFETGIIDQSVIRLQINGTDSGFSALPSGSKFSSSTGGFTGNEITINVEATTIVFSQQPSDTTINDPMQPAVKVSFEDVNGNLDTGIGITSVVDLTSTGTLDATLSENVLDGVATFLNVNHTTVGTFELTASSSSFSDITSNQFDIISRDLTSEVVVPGTQTTGITLAPGDSAEVFNFNISDLGSGDGFSTEVTQMRFVAGINNDADWPETINEVIVKYNGGAAIPGTYSAFTDNEVIFTPTDAVSIPDGTSVNFSVDVVLNTTEITDESRIEFAVEGTNSGFQAASTGSGFNTNFSTVNGNIFTIEVVATAIIFRQQPTDVGVNSLISPAVQVAYIDANNNVDSSNTADITLTSSVGSSPINSPVTVAPVNGIATFSNIGYTAIGTDITLEAETPDTSLSPFSITSDPFDVGRPVIAVQDFDGTMPEWTYTTSIPTFGDPNNFGNDYFDVIALIDASPTLSFPNFSENIFGENDLNSPNGTSGFASLDFETIDVSGYTNVQLSFDWEVVGYNVNEDQIEYEVFFDGSLSPDGRVNLFTGGDNLPSDSEGSGSETISIPAGTKEVSFRYFIRNDGVDGFSGLDNVKLTGDSNARDTDIIAVDPQIEGGTIFADINDGINNAVEVFGFEIVDSGNFDALPTNVTRLRFVPGSGNTADWAEVIQGISISEGTNTLSQADQTVTITSDEILVDIAAGSPNIFEVPDGSPKSYTVSVFLNTSGITDQEVIQLAIAEGNQDQLASSDGSIFSQDITAFEGNAFNIEVIGTQLEFFEQPTNTALGESMVPFVRVRNLDTNGNVDLDEVTVSITSTGTLDGDGTTETISRSISASNGYANFNTLQHTAIGFGLRLTASSSGLTSATSNAFDITFETNLLISEVTAPTDPNERYVELFNMGVEPIDFSAETYYLHNATPDGTSTVNSIQLTGTLEAKSYYIVGFSSDGSFTEDLIASNVVTGDGNDAYYLSIQNTPESLVDIHGEIDATGISVPDSSWDYTDGRFYRNIPTVRNSNQVFDLLEWTKSSAAATPGVGDNDFVYTGNWTTSGLGNPEGGSFSGSNSDKSIFVESGTATLSNANTISDVVVRAGATLIIEDLITLDGDFANFGKVTFRSTGGPGAKTGVLGEFDALNRKLVGDNFEIERFIPADNRAFRYLAPSVTTTSSINANWQEGANNTEVGVNENPNPGFGTHITGSTNGLNGFDATLTGNPSMFQWRPNLSTPAWQAIPNTDSKTFNAGEAYAILIRGDRSTTLQSNTAVGPETTLRTTGRLKVGSSSAPEVAVATSLNGFSLIGNPYQARVNLETLLAPGNATAVSSTYVYIYDPTLGTRGGYATVELSSGATFETDLTTPLSSNVTNILEPNQAFFVETVESGSPIVIFRESYKASQVGGNVAFSLPEEQTNLFINLFFDDLEAKAVDGVKVKFRAGGNNAKDTLDATKVWNYGESFAIDRNPNYMSIESRAMPTTQDSVPLYFGNATRSAYRLEIKPENFAGAEVFLYDRYLETSTELPSDVTTSVSFELDNSIPESKATDRFVFRFEEKSLSDEDFELNSTIAVYPNPVIGERLSISHQQAFSGNEVNLQLFDLQGRLVLDQKIDNAPQVEVNIGSDLSSGVYILKLSDGKVSQSVKLIVE
ncbi:beta strand repeat-containing protein [Psychroflexus sediminis]|uniref:Por secretion system C-terminal sorting domain-containing protein n=1 Tax=Psychroflexus sediminis TaxID=470826 RepID=A0A1G7X1R0_9FLAO|nr:T9SS type A sorting domain-containing protein [Psychroflexus sediminis]SDG78077.1 Por secretion system C-terminal sorting domain-containing protein [Psychroflexus sediminis]